MAANIAYRIMPRFVKHTTEKAVNGDSTAEFCWVMFEILNNDIRTATPLCYFTADQINLSICTAALYLADHSEPLDAVKLQLPAAIL